MGSTLNKPAVETTVLSRILQEGTTQKIKDRELINQIGIDIGKSG